MGLRFILGNEQGDACAVEDPDYAVLWDSVTGIAFGLAVQPGYAVANSTTGPDIVNLDALAMGDRFLAWCEHERGIVHGDVRAVTVQEVIDLQEEWARLGYPAARTPGQVVDDATEANELEAARSRRRDPLRGMAAPTNRSRRPRP